jgi:hypothetical protein
MRYSLISCFHTMEHVSDPTELARGTFRLLKPGGAAFFIGHNLKSVVNRILGMKSAIIDVEHLQLFSRKSARALFERAGFVDVEIKPVWNCYPLQYWIKLFPLPKPARRAVLEVLKATRVGRLPTPMNVGNIAVIGYRPTGPGFEL